MAREVGDRRVRRHVPEDFRERRRNFRRAALQRRVLHPAGRSESIPQHQYGDGCLADQMFGQGWAHQVGLGLPLSEETVGRPCGRSGSTIGRPTSRRRTRPIRRNAGSPCPARRGCSPAPGLTASTWGTNSVLYRDEIWTGIEYQVAGHMVWEGMLTEALAIAAPSTSATTPPSATPGTKSSAATTIPAPWPATASLPGPVRLRISRPQGHLGFAPRITPEDFRARLHRGRRLGHDRATPRSGVQTERIAVRWGKLPLKTLRFESPEKSTLQKSTVTLAGKPLAVDAQIDGRSVHVALAAPLILKSDEELTVEFRHA